ncbi:MAG: cytochrome ubiquinol oxidase subunit I, partial [Ktedonobacteraceae bacterium]|nr:cytochrome ubiquinol oxidase subunit I [Ktedonobacteraceae bacterium]
PWVVFGLLQTNNASSPNVGIGSLWISLITFTLLYGALAVVDGYLLVKYAKEDAQLETVSVEEEVLVSSY